MDRGARVWWWFNISEKSWNVIGVMSIEYGAYHSVSLSDFEAFPKEATHIAQSAVWRGRAMAANEGLHSICNTLDRTTVAAFSCRLDAGL